MSDEPTQGKFQVLEFKKPQEEPVPKFVVDLLEKMLEQAKKGELTTLVAHFNYHMPDDDTYTGGTVLWNKTNNPVELLGLTEIVKSIALDYVYGVPGDKEGDK